MRVFFQDMETTNNCYIIFDDSVKQSYSADFTGFSLLFNGKSSGCFLALTWENIKSFWFQIWKLQVLPWKYFESSSKWKQFDVLTFFGNFRKQWKSNTLILTNHCVKSVQIRSYFWSEYRKIRTRNNPVFGQFSRSDGNNWPH